MNSDADVMKYFPQTGTKEETAAMLKRINAHFDTHGFGLFAVENKATGNFIGFTGLAVPTFESFFTPCIEIGWRYKKEVWGTGFAGEAAGACLQYGFHTLQLNKIVSFTSAINQPSEAVMQRIGMTRAGHFYHPKIEEGSPLRLHVLYQITAPR